MKAILLFWLIVSCGTHVTLADNNSTTALPPPKTTGIRSEYPPEIFTLEEKQHGAFLLYIIGMCYMFVGLAIVCDEFFVPSLNCIIDSLKISEDVAGATFMAAGGSAPELFTSFIGVFIAHNDVGIGTIVGSAVFNILFVIGMCALFSKTILKLTWWPLFRDVCFYVIGLILLIIFFEDQIIKWWEALCLLLWFVAYGSFMKFNVFAEKAVKSLIHRKHPAIDTKLAITKRAKRVRRSQPSVFFLMVHSAAPLAGVPMRANVDIMNQLSSIADEGDKSKSTEENQNDAKKDVEAPANEQQVPAPLAQPEEMDSDEQPLDISWPKTCRKRILYLIILPIIFPLWLTLPDVKKPEKRKWFPITFVGSILWIGLFSYCMVWWASRTGETFELSPAVMGITVLAAGTSIPDLITSVIVARRGFGDMAVSSSIGSNIFDITVGLPFPWLLYCIINSTYVTVNSSGLFCSILLLFAMLVMIIAAIAAFKWRMSKWMGITMFGFYGVFVAFSVCIELGVLPCIL